jgi:hypothetical protein
MMKRWIASVSFLAASVPLFGAEGIATESTKVESHQPWSASYLNEVGGPNLQFKSDSAMNQYLSLGYSLENSWKLSFTGVFESQFKRTDSDSHNQGNHYFKLAAPSFVQNDILSLTPQMRFYVPTSQTSQNTKSAGIYNPRLSLKSTQGDLNLEYTLSASIYSYTQKLQVPQTAFTHGHIFTASYNMTDWVSMDMLLYPFWTYTRNSTEARYKGLELQPGVSFTVNDQISVSTGLNTYAKNMSTKTTSFVGEVAVKFL